MEQQINSIIRNACIDIKLKPHNRKTIRQNYDHIFLAIKTSGYTDFVAHQWTMSTLSKLFGSIKVNNAVQYCEPVTV